MITDFVISIIQFIDSFISGLDVFTALTDLITKLNTYQTYINEFQIYLSGAYYIFGKSLIVFVVSVGATVFVIKLCMAIVMIVGQFIP